MLKKMKGFHLYGFSLLRQLYNWVLSWAHKKYSSLALFILSFAESSFFPIPPDVLQIALSVEKPKRAYFYAFISTVGSVLGGIFGYFIGLKLWDVLQDFFFTYIPGFSHHAFEVIQAKYELYNFWIVFTAGFTPIPYKIITVSAGVFEIGFLIFVIASTLSRSARFFLVATLLYFFGPKIKDFIDKYFNILTIVFLILFIGGFIVIKHAL